MTSVRGFWCLHLSSASLYACRVRDVGIKGENGKKGN